MSAQSTSNSKLSTTRVHAASNSAGLSAVVRASRADLVRRVPVSLFLACRASKSSQRAMSWSTLATIRFCSASGGSSSGKLPRPTWLIVCCPAVVTVLLTICARDAALRARAHRKPVSTMRGFGRTRIRWSEYAHSPIASNGTNLPTRLALPFTRMTRMSPASSRYCLASADVRTIWRNPSRRSLLPPSISASRSTGMALPLSPPRLAMPFRTSTTTSESSTGFHEEGSASPRSSPLTASSIASSLSLPSPPAASATTSKLLMTFFASNLCLRLSEDPRCTYDVPVASMSRGRTRALTSEHLQARREAHPAAGSESLRSRPPPPGTASAVRRRHLGPHRRPSGS